MSQTPIASHAAVSAPGPLASVPTGNPADYTLTLEVVSLTASHIRLGLEDSPDGTHWTPLAVWSFAGPASDNSKTLRAYDTPNLQANIRVNVYQLAGGGASVNATIA